MKWTPVALLFVVAGCAVGPSYQRPQVDVPGRFRDHPEQEAASLADQPWWEVFRDPILQSLIREALKNSFDIRTALWRVEEFRARAGIARSEYLPGITPSAQWQRARQSEYVQGNGTPGSAYAVDLGLSWEIDLWGRIRRLNEAARAQYLASEEARRGAYLSVAADVAQAYFELRMLDSQLEIARKTTQSFQQTLDLFNRRLEGGIASALETTRAQASLANASAFVPTLERQVMTQENLLCFLLGRPPGPIPRGQALGDQWFPPTIPAGLPSALLERRPDLREAEQQLRAANASVGIATANYFPVFSLTGAFGGISPTLSNLFKKGRTWSFGADLLGPVLQATRLKNEKDVSRAQWEQTKVQYEASVTNALNEVSTALGAQEQLSEAEKDQAQAVSASREAVRLANLRYVAGLSSYIEVLDAQQQLFPAENSLAQARFNRLANFVQLYKALGGGWNLEDPARNPVP